MDWDGQPSGKRGLGMQISIGNKLSGRRAAVLVASGERPSRVLSRIMFSRPVRRAASLLAPPGLPSLFYACTKYRPTCYSSLQLTSHKVVGLLEYGALTQVTICFIVSVTLVTSN